MAASNRPSARRLPSGPWSRLMPANVDALDVFGLPSKGETRLNDLKTQESYYNKIVERFMQFCADRGAVQELDKAFALMSMSEGHGGDEMRIHPLPNNGKLQKSQSEFHNASTTQMELQIIMHAMRKLREAIVAVSRCDLFAQRAYVFIIRASILTHQLESYHPALLYLLRAIHPRQRLPQPEVHEFLGYRILDLCCRQRDLHAAYACRSQYGYHDRRVDKVLNALVHDDWVTFWRVRRTVDGHQRALMEYAVDDMRLHALKSIGRTYMSVERTFLERNAELNWKSLVKQCGIGWELDASGEHVMIKRPKQKGLS